MANYKNTPEIEALTVDVALAKLQKYMRRARKGRISHTTAHRIYKWTCRLAHVVFEENPELREHGSLIRYFVAKRGRKDGLRGTALTKFVEEQYEDGTWWKLVPEEVLKGETKLA